MTKKEELIVEYTTLSLEYVNLILSQEIIEDEEQKRGIIKNRLNKIRILLDMKTI